jgi:predicted GIY-YIG superfamily endonuclease
VSTADLRPHVVYRLRDKYGECIYIGMTHDLGMRLRHHRSDFVNPWARYVDSHEVVETYPNRTEAHAAEVAAIEAERPPFNLNHAGRDATAALEYEARWKAREPEIDPAALAELRALFSSSP